MTDWCFSQTEVQTVTECKCLLVSVSVISVNSVYNIILMPEF